MARAYFYTYALDDEGRPIAGPTVNLYDADTTTEISETIYAADTGGTTKTNPFTGDADGRIEFFLDVPKVLDIKIQKVGYDDLTIRAIAHQLTAATTTLLDDGVSMAQRAGINFQDGFALTDDAVGDETEVDLDYATTEIADIGTVEDDGVSTKVPRADHVHVHPVIASGDLHSEYVQESAHTAAAHDALALSHDSLADVSTDDHHAEAHARDGAAHTGTQDHGSTLTGLTDDDHTQYLKEKASGGTAAETPTNTHANSGQAGTVSHDDLTGVSNNDHHPEVHKPTMHNPVLAIAFLTADHDIISTNTFSWLAADVTALYDSDGIIAGTGVFKVPAAMAGLWRLSGVHVWEEDTDGRRKCVVLVNGLTEYMSNTGSGLSGGEDLSIALPSIVLELDVADEISFNFTHNAGNNRHIRGPETKMCFEWIGPA